MVWTSEHTGRFLDHAADDRLSALFHLISFRGLRHGEACGQKWTDTHLDAGLITVAERLVVDGSEVDEDDPKTDAGARTIALVADRLRSCVGTAPGRTRNVRNGGPLGWKPGERRTTPPIVTRRFIELHEEVGLPPVRLHDLRHGAATLAHAAGAGLKDIQEMLGHSSITITSDTCTSLLPEADLAIAEAAARLVPRARATAESMRSGAGAQFGEGDESVPDGADPWGRIGDVNSPSAHAPLTQTAPDEKSEAE
ncbi:MULTISPECIES: tyrosine-type recombinase/integrase [unclassified Streptomyces]|uniref:tyrosine-type recombinase/integrase n=1 Tax=unclassified Streptomyces TaxID=2593676 RepID=UPI000997A08B|nr:MULTISPECIES: tyrosine-type recombinase/integrase [unclassified Streptomyces]MYY01215.1 tyrosine-type recombinase/integrase [Streptomyces sp. SID4913]